MTRKTKQYLLTNIVLFICFLLPACDFNCKGSSLRNYKPSDRIEKINKEILKLEKISSDKKARARLGDLYEQLATIYIQQEDLDTAHTNINTAFKYGRNTPYLNYIAGLVFGNRAAKSHLDEDIIKAEEYYRNAVSLKPDYEDALYSLAILLFFYKNQRDEPITILEKLYVKSRSNYRIRFALGRVYYESGRKEDALFVYKEIQADLEKLSDSPMTQEYRKVCSENIQKIQKEIQ